MSESNKSYRIRTVVGQDTNLTVNLDQSYDVFEVLSIKLKQEDTYRLHTSNYGVIVGRVLANEGFGVPNAKVSVFIKGEYDASSNAKVATVYPYQTTSSQGMDGVQYNLLPDNQVDDCHQVVGTFPNKTYMLDNDVLIEVFDKYYKYTTRTNNSGDYIICGVPVGQQTLHMDLDLSDCGILSQRPRDFVYKGYTIEQFENPNQFKTGTDLNSLSQIFRQDTVVNVIPFWGNEELGETIGITRADINVNFKFEPTCVFMGCLVGDNSSNGVSKKCVPTNQMGAMDELTTGEGTIEMIRKTPNGDVEEFQIKGTQLIDGNGVWCYQIPMNLDYMMTDEYGNMVPTDDPTKGIPTRARVRFRISMHDTENNTDNYFRAKVLVPHNPQNYFSGETLMHEDYDYEFGTYTKEESFRDLFWNNVYTVKSYIPRFQKSKLSKTERFTGIKHCNIYGQNNPMPYNNIRIKLPLMFTLICVLIKTYVLITGLVNGFISLAGNALADLGNTDLIPDWVRSTNIFGWKPFANWHIQPFVSLYRTATTFHITTIAEGICPDLENWYFAPIKPRSAYWDNFADSQTIPPGQKPYNILQQTFEYLEGTTSNNPNTPEAKEVSIDSNSIDESNRPDERTVCLTINTDYLISCLEMNLAQEYKVINFDFYNDWVNGAIYMPRWMRFVRKKRTYLFGLIKIKPKIKACMDDSKVFGKTRYYTQQCALAYSKVSGKYTKIDGHNGCMKSNKSKSQNCHKNNGLKRYTIFGSGSKKNTKGNGGAVHEKETMLNQFVYYFKPCEWRTTDGKKTILFANDLVLLGSLNDCNLYGIPQAFKYLTSSSYIMPTNLALTNMDDDSYLYADEAGTFCSPSKSINETSDEPTLQQLDTTFSATSKYYTTSPNEDVTYGNADDPEVLNYDDTIPLTEAAGISWNYTGPGQGTPSRDVTKSIYYPGGHFLGLSCVNSMTNIKSCVNLQRICEAGSTMSQRREEVKTVSYTPSAGETDIRYKYFVPTGLVAQDDINGKDFRSMFATMNKNRLLCNGKLDEKTGYPIYDFVYMRPNGFDGSLKDRVAKDARYNTGVTITDESTWMKKVGVTESEDYDRDERTNTETRTIEDASEDYYMFRLGLNTLNDSEQKSRFLIDGGSKVALPQYENSFYFYFGLKDGSSALDEFNKQFFSTCESKSIFMNTPSITATEVFDKCDLTFKLKIKIENMSSPATLTIKNRAQNQTYLISQGVTGKTTMNFTYPDNVTGDAPALTIGTYEIEVTDSEDQTAVETVSVGLNSVRINTETKDFEFKTKNLTTDEIIENANALTCGYIEYEDTILVWDEEAKTYLPKNISEDEWGLIVVDNEGNYAKTINYVIPDVCIGTDYTSASYIGNRFYLWKADEEYDLYLVHICNGQYYSVYYATYRIGGIDNYDLYLGSKYLPYSTKLKSLTGEWWNNVGSDDVDDRNWAIRHALFRQTDDDAELFTNAVIALDNNGKIIDTALFGEPEIYNSETGKYKPEGRVYYEGDTDYFGGDLSDDSILSTWGYLDEDELVDPTRKREQFGEMAMYNGVVASDKLCDMVGTFEEDGNAIKIVPIPPEEIPFKISEGQGCIVKLNDGTIVYPVNRGGYLYYYGELPEQTEQQISIYPTFIFPVMYKPFYGQMNMVEWVGSRLIMEYTGAEEMPMVSNDLEWYVSRLNVFNGITYKGNFDETSESSICNRKIYSDAGIAKSGDSNDLDGGESRPTLRIFDCSAKTETIDTIGFSVKEGSPLSSLSQESDEYKELNAPNKVSLATIDCMSSLDMPSYINYKYDETGTDIIFVSDNNGSSADFYLCTGRCPIKARGAVGMISINNSGYVLGKYNQNAYDKSSKNNVGEDVFVQIDVVTIFGITSIIIGVPMFTSDDADTQVTVTKSILNYTITAEGATTIEKLLNQMTIGDSIYNAAYDLGVTLEYNYVQDGLTYDATSTYTNIDETTSFVKKKINLEVANETSVGNGDYVIGITTEPSGEKGYLKVARIYPNIKQIAPYVPPSEDIVTIVPNAEDGVSPSVTENSGTTFISEGGELQVRVKAVGSWTFTLDSNSWLRIKDGSNLVTSITGSGSQYITVKAEENTTTEDRMVTGTAVSNADGSISAYTVFLSIQKTVKNYIEPVTITTFAKGGGELGVRVVSNRDEAWALTITNSSADDWVKFSDGSMTMTGNGNYTAYLIAEPNDGQNSRNVIVSIEGPEGGEGILTFIQNAAQIELEVIPLVLSFDKNGGTQYLSVRCNGEWTSSKNASATWLTLENGTDTIKVIAAPSNEEPRTAQITVKSPSTSDHTVERVVNISQSDGVPKYIDTTFSATAVTCEEQNNVVITVDSNTDWKLVKDNDVNWFKFPDDLKYVAGSSKASITCSVDKNYWEERTCTIQTKATLLDCIPNPETTVFYQGESEYEFQVQNATKFIIKSINYTTTDGGTLNYSDMYIYSWDWKNLKIFDYQYNCSQVSVTLTGEDLTGIDRINFMGLTLQKNDYGNFVGFGSFNVRHEDVYVLTL